MSIYGESVININVDGYAKTTYIDTVVATKVSKSGGTMTGILAMGSIKITGVTDPTEIQDAATRNYVDTLGALKLAKTGDTMSGALAMGSNRITGVADPRTAQDAATKTMLTFLER